jgi:glycosyltransferase involved in cell wall biosynthesis
VAIGRLIEQKNLGLLLEAMAQLKQLGSNVRLRIIGDGPKREHLERRARGLGIQDSVRFVGAVPPDDIPGHLSDADVMVFPAIREGLGLVAAEALLMGVPVVATHMGGGVTDIVPPTGAGRLVPADDPHAMALAIRDLITDRSSLARAAETGRSLRRRLEPDAVARVFETVYQSALAGKTRRA